MNLIIDYGNTKAKVGIFDHRELKQHYSFEDELPFKKFLQATSADHLIVSSVSIDAAEVTTWGKISGKKLILSHTSPLPIVNLYATPATLGMDRLAGVCAAIQLFPHEHTLVIDAGTCIKYDFIDKDKNYLGGAISPGLSMRFKAVHTFTSRLPMVAPTNDPQLIGNSTETSIQSGVINGMVEEIDGIILRYQEKYPDLKVILSGGDGAFFENKLKASIFAIPNMVLIGLNSILIYNVDRS
jgi:type III pantothenate kinase